jgi:hypothetical protein
LGCIAGEDEDAEGHGMDEVDTVAVLIGSAALVAVIKEAPRNAELLLFK